jgi:membrane protein
LAAAGAPIAHARPWMKLHTARRMSRAGHYLDQDLWTADLSIHGFPVRAGIRLLRVLVAVARAPFDGPLNLEAAALVYRTLLSIVPLLAVAFSVLKAFGAQYRIEPLLVQMLSPLGSGGVEVARRIVEFVSNVGVGVLGTVGLIGLFYTVVSLIEGIENALNQIWHVRRSRTLMRKFTDYLSILLVGPVLVFAALGIIASAQSNRLVQRVVALTPFRPDTIAAVWHVAPFVLLVAAFTLLYRFLPYARVAPGAALVGGVTAATLWHIVGLAFTALVASSTSYSAIYSGFAVFVVFLLWLQIAWLVVLVGGEVAYIHQHPTSYVAVRGRPSVRLREHAGLGAIVEITRRYLAGEPPLRLDDLARLLGAPLAIVDEVIEDFVTHGFLARVVEPDGVVLARTPELITVAEVLAAIREPAHTVVNLDPADGPAADALRRRDDAVDQALAGLTLYSVATAGPTAESVVAKLSAYRRR